MLPRRRTTWLRIGVTLGVFVLGVWLVSLVSVVAWERRDNARPAAAIVVLGAAQYVGHPSPVLRARIDHAIELWRRGFAPRIIFTGGFGTRDTTSEAAVGQHYAVKQGIPPSSILIENSGRTTMQSMEQVAMLMKNEPSRKVILVSDPFHMLRLAITARKFGLTPYTSPTRTSPISMSRREELRYMLAESFKVPIAFLQERRE